MELSAKLSEAAKKAGDKVGFGVLLLRLDKGYRDGHATWFASLSGKPELNEWLVLRDKIAMKFEPRDALTLLRDVLDISAVATECLTKDDGTKESQEEALTRKRFVHLRPLLAEPPKPESLVDAARAVLGGGSSKLAEDASIKIKTFGKGVEKWGEKRRVAANVRRAANGLALHPDPPPNPNPVNPTNPATPQVLPPIPQYSKTVMVVFCAVVAVLFLLVILFAK
jgi:hypothetical protein